MLYIQQTDADVYVTLLTHGELSKEELKSLFGAGNVKIDKAILNLLKRGLIWELANDKGDHIYQALSMLQLEEKLERDREIVRHLKKFVMPKIQQPQKLGIVRYEGIEGIQKVYIEVLEEAKKTGETILAFETELDAPPIGKVFLENYIENRIKSGVRAFVIAPDTQADRTYKKNYQGKFTFVKLVPGLEIEANINIVGDLVMSYAIDAQEGVLRRNSSEANTLKSAFMKLWESLPE